MVGILILECKDKKKTQFHIKISFRKNYQIIKHMSLKETVMFLLENKRYFLKVG